MVAELGCKRGQFLLAKGQIKEHGKGKFVIFLLAFFS